MRNLQRLYFPVQSCDSLLVSAELKINAADLVDEFLQESGHDAINLRRVPMDQIVPNEKLIEHNFFVYDVSIEERNFNREIGKRGAEMYEESFF